MNTIKQRLAAYRKNAETTTATYAKNYKSTIVFSWKDRRYPKPAILSVPVKNNPAPDGKDYVESLENYGGAALLGDAADFCKLDHTGWYADSFQDDLITGAVMVFRNPHRFNTEDGGHRFFMAATYSTEWGCGTVYRNGVYDNQAEAARAADRIAESEADDCRRANAQDQAEQEVIRLKEQLHENNKEALCLIKEVKSNTEVLPPAVCGVVKAAVYSLIRERSKIFKRIEALKDNFWLAVE